MRPVLYVLSFIAVIGLAFWAYRENYATQSGLRDVAALQQEIGALREALADGTIDIVATDHAPHPVESKDCEWGAAAFGMVGLESALAVVQTTMVETGLIGWAEVARVMSEAPARIGGLTTHGQRIEPSIQAELVLVDPSTRRNFGVEDLASLSHNTPYLGIELAGQVVSTIHQGYLTASDRHVVTAETVAAQAELVARG